MVDSFKNKRSPWFLKNRDPKKPPAMIESLQSPSEQEKPAAVEKQDQAPIKETQPGFLARLTNRFNTWANRLDQMRLPYPTGLGRSVFKWLIFLTIIASPFYFLPPVFNYFYFWREIALITLALGLLGSYALCLLSTTAPDNNTSNLEPRTSNTGLSLLKGPFNLALFFAFTIWLLAIIFSPARLFSLTSTTAWGYLALLIIAFVLANNYPLYKARGWRLILGLEAFLVIIFWLILLTPWLPKINSALGTNLARPQVLGLQESWVVAIESIQNRPILGSGPGLYTSTFLQYRSIRSNLSDNWGSIFTHPFWPGFELVSSFGLLGIASLAALGWGWLKSYRPRLEPRTSNLELPLFASRAAAIVLLIITALGAFANYRVSYAQITFQQALAKINANAAANDVYLTLQKAINLNPYQANYHRTYANVSFILANIVANSQDQNADQQNTIQQLINQSTRETRIITEALNPNDARNWETRGQIYQQLIGMAADAQNWAIGAYQQASALNPANPNLRIGLGGIYFQLAQAAGQQKNLVLTAKADPKSNITQTDREKAAASLEETRANYLDLAVEQFRIAVRLKPDLANAHYNLGFAYRELGRSELAKSEFQRALSLVEKGSADEERAKTALESLGEPAGTGATPSPSPAASPTPTIKIEPTATATPTPQPTATPTPQPTATPTPQPTATVEPTPTIAG